VVDDLLARTHKRSYVAVVRGGQLKVAVERGLQGMPKLPGFQPCIGDNMHAVALGKVVLALARDDVVTRYARSPGLRPFTEHTITDHAALRAELDAVRARGYAVEREEFDRDFCCIAAPVRAAHGRFLAAIGISMSRRAFDEEHKALARTVMAVARAAGRGAVGGAPLRAVEGRATGQFQASAETRHVLDRVPRRPLACVDGSTAP
jgi:acetyl-CoA synthetase